MGARRSNLVTKADLQRELERFATKKDLDHVVETLSADIRAVGATVERVESHVRLLAEGLVATRKQLERKIDGVEERLSARIAVLQQVVRQNSTDIHGNREAIEHNARGIRANAESIEALRVEVAGLRSQLVKRENLDELETRVAAVEKRVGIAPK